MWIDLIISDKGGLRVANHLVKTMDEATKLWKVYTSFGFTVKMEKLRT